VRENWWHLVAFAPVAVVVGGAVGGAVGAMLIMFSILPYPLAMRWDTKYIAANSQSASPGTGVATVLGVLVLLTFGIASYLVTPYHLYRRWKHLR
jgi:hypothetical protein